MIRSIKTILKKQTNKKRTNKTLGQMVKAKLYRQESHKEAYTYTLTKREKGNIYIYIYIYIYILKRKEENNQINKQTYQ